MAAQNAKCVLVSAAVKAPFPTSSISTSLWPQKSTALRRKLFPFKVWEMPDHFAVQKIESSAIPHSSCDMSVRNSSTFVLDLAGDLRVISPVVLHELPVAFPHVITSAFPHSQSENRMGWDCFAIASRISLEPLCCIWCAPIITFWSLICVVTSSVDEWAWIGSVRHTELVLIVLACWVIAVVRFQICVPRKSWVSEIIKQDPNWC